MKLLIENICIKIIMFISSYFPLYIMVFILYFDKLIKGLQQKKMSWIIFAIVIILVVAISFLSIYLLLKGNGKKYKSIEGLKRPDDTVLSYIMTYIIPLVSGQHNSTQVYLVNFLLFLLIGYIYIRLNLIYLNPLWAIFGYNIYHDDEEIIITNISYNLMKHAKVIRGYYLSNGIFVAHKHNNRIDV